MKCTMSGQHIDINVYVGGAAVPPVTIWCGACGRRVDVTWSANEGPVVPDHDRLPVAPGTLEEIAVTLAAADPVSADDMLVSCCVLCGVEAVGEERRLRSETSHDPACPWRQAREWSVGWQKALLR